MLQQAIGEASGRGAAIKRHAPCHVDPKTLNRRLKFIATPADVAMPAPYAQHSITSYEHTRLIDELLVDQHLPRHDPRPGLLSTLEDAAFSE